MNPIIPTDAIFAQDDSAMTSSLKVAEAFSKHHKHVLEKIQSLDCTADFASANFSADVQNVSIGNGATRESKYYRMTKNGFIFLVMGFTGKKAAQIKEAYISAFDMMADELKKRAPATLASIMGQTIGTDGFHCLGAVLEGKVRHLPVPTRKRIKQHIWSQVHKAFSVVSAQDIPADKMAEARNFIAAYQVLEGELVSDREIQAQPVQDVDSIEYVHAWLRVAHHRHTEMMAVSREAAKLSEDIRQITERLDKLSRNLFDPIREPLMHLPRPKGYSAGRAECRAKGFIKMQEGIA